MNFDLTDDQRAFADMAAGLFADYCSDEQLRAHDAAGTEPFYRAVAAVRYCRNLNSILVPEEHGGLGLGMTERWLCCNSKAVRWHWCRCGSCKWWWLRWRSSRLLHFAATGARNGPWQRVAGGVVAAVAIAFARFFTATEPCWRGLDAQWF